MARATATMTVNVDPALQIILMAIPNWKQGKPITAVQLPGIGIVPPFEWNVTGLPDGVVCSKSGAITGTPVITGEQVTHPYPLTITLDDAS